MRTKELVLLKFHAYFNSEQSLKIEDLGLKDSPDLEDFDLVEVKLFQMPYGYYITDFYGKDLVTLMVGDRNFTTNMSEEEYLELMVDTLCY